MVRKVKWRRIIIALLAILLLVYVVVAIIQAASGLREPICKKVEICIKDSSEMQFVSADDVNKLLLSKNIKLIGQTKNKINASKIEKELMKDPVILRTECFLKTNGDLGINVWQRKPIFRVFGNKNYYVDEEGMIFPTSEHYTAYVLIVTGDFPISFAKKELCDFVKCIQKDVFWAAQIEQIDVDENGELVLIPRIGDCEIIFGTLLNSDKKLARLKVFYKNGIKKIGWGKYKSINVAFDNQVVCEKK